VKIKKAKKGKRKIKLVWKKVKGAKSYQVQYSKSSKFKKATNKYTKKKNITLKKLKSKKRYYIRVRAVNGSNYGKWSKVKKVKVK